MDVVLGVRPCVTFRDAIHVAVVPMIASEMLRPGQHVGVLKSGTAGLKSGTAGPTSSNVGIVDPFLRDVVPRGERFWLLLYPQSVTGMRHHWSHPAFDGDAPTNEPEKPSVLASVEWLRKAAAMLGCDYEDLVSPNSQLVTADYINNGEHIRDVWYDIQDEFWIHHENVTGHSTPEDDRGGFTCSC